MTYGLMISASMLGYFLMKPKIAVIGESCIDEYVYGTCDRVCPEAAALCFHHKNIKTTNPGMAGNTYENLKALNKDDVFYIELITSASPIIKRRFIDIKYNSIVFREDVNDKCEPIELSNFNLSTYDCIIISDYNKGFLEEEDIDLLLDLFDKNDVFPYLDYEDEDGDDGGYDDYDEDEDEY